MLFFLHAMIKRKGVRILKYLSMWTFLIIYAWLLAAKEKRPRHDEVDLWAIRNSGATRRYDFSCLGLFPLLFASLIMPNDSFKLPGWPFSLLSFGLGAFALLPYFVLKGEKSTKSRGFNLLNKWLTSPTFLLSLLTITLILYLYGFAAGSFSGYIEAFKHSELVSVMTVDFLSLLG